MSRDRNIDHWDAEDVEAWESGGNKIARRNLIWSIFAEHVGFSIWSIWSVMVLFMPQNAYQIDAAGKFYLVAMPGPCSGDIKACRPLREFRYHRGDRKPVIIGRRPQAGHHPGR